MHPDEDGLRRAIATLVPELAGRPLRLNPRFAQSDPRYWSATAWIGDDFVVKHAWSAVRSERLLREAALLDRLRPLPVPEVVAVSESPAIVVARAVEGSPLSWEWGSDLGGEALASVAADLGAFLGRLHALPVADVLDGLPAVVPTAQADTGRLRQRFPAIVDDRRAAMVLAWCDWVDGVFAAAAPTDVIVHGDLHGYNQVWDVGRARLRAVVDFEECGAGDRHFDFRYLPGNAATPALVLAVVAAYERATGIALDLDRIMAWNVLSHLGDALWRTEAGAPLPGGGDPPGWVDDLERRFEALASRSTGS